MNEVKPRLGRPSAHYLANASLEEHQHHIKAFSKGILPNFEVFFFARETLDRLPCYWDITIIRLFFTR